MAHITYFKQPKGHRKNKKYLEAVTKLPCYMCGTSPVQAHHKIGGVKGMGLKSPDTESIPLCQACHMRIHKDYNWFDQEEAVELTRQKLIALNLILGVDK